MITKLEELNINKRRDYEFIIYMDEEFYTQLEKMMTPIGYAAQTIWTNLIYGTIIGLILSFFVKKEKSIFE